MENQTQHSYFSPDSLKKMIEAEGKQLKGVICFLWQNSINPSEVMELIDHVQFVFTDGYKLTFGCNELNNGMEVVDYDFNKEKIEIEKEFEGKIKLLAANASPTKMWKDVINLKLLGIKLTKIESNYLSDSIMLDFGTEQRTIGISPMDGLIIDYYEE